MRVSPVTQPKNAGRGRGKIVPDEQVLCEMQLKTKLRTCHHIQSELLCSALQEIRHAVPKKKCVRDRSQMARSDCISHVWVLSLEDPAVRGPDRGIDRMRSNLDRYGLQSAVGFAAVDGRRVSSAALRRFEPSVVRAGLGVVGCYMSHVAMWRKAAKIRPDDEVILLLEDDVRAVKTVRRSQLPRGFDLVYLGHAHEDPTSPEVFPGFRKSVNPVTTCAYAITPRSARKLLRLHKRRWAIDHELVHMIRSGSVTAASAIPPWISVRKTVDGSSIGAVSGCRGDWVSGSCVS